MVLAKRPNLLSLATATAFLISFASIAQASEIQPLTQSKLVEVINEVKILQGESLEALDAEEAMVFRAPDFLETGRRSRARMEADDGTITRVGSNTLFSFDEASRTINLKKGSLLFHSPEGKGGGRVVTASATASVLGTTIMTVSTLDGGFKVLVLEGTARVDFPDGTSRILAAGQMTFVLPDRNVGSSGGTGGKSGSKGKSSGSTPGPVLNFELSKLTEDSDLLNGFSDSIESQGKIDQATKIQIQQLKNGELLQTGKIVIAADEDETIVADPPKEPNETIPDTDPPTSNPLVEVVSGINSDLAEVVPETNSDPTEEQQRLIDATESTVFPNDDGFVAENFFDYPGVEPFPGTFPEDPNEVDDANANDDEHFDPFDKAVGGFIAKNINFTGGPLDVSPITMANIDPVNHPGDSFIFIGALDTMSFSDNVQFTGFQGENYFEMSTFGGFDLTPGKTILIGDSPPTTSTLLPYKVHLQIHSTPILDAENFTFSNYYGTVELSSEVGIRLTDYSYIFAGNSVFYETGSNLTPYGNIHLFSDGFVVVNNSSLYGQGRIEIGSEGTVRIGPDFDATFATGSTQLSGREIDIFGANNVTIRNSYINTSVAPAGQGEIRVHSESGSIRIGPDSNLNSDRIYMEAQKGNLSITGSGSYITANDWISINAGETIKVSNQDISANFIEFHGHDVDISNTLMTQSGSELRVIAQDLAELSNINLSNLTRINIEGNTVALSDFVFPNVPAGNISLGSQMGMLAPSPNTGATAVNGYVNFINNVTVDGLGNAENFVDFADGGNASIGATIDIYAK